MVVASRVTKQICEAWRVNYHDPNPPRWFELGTVKPEQDSYVVYDDRENEVIALTPSQFFSMFEFIEVPKPEPQERKTFELHLDTGQVERTSGTCELKQLLQTITKGVYFTFTNVHGDEIAFKTDRIVCVRMVNK